MTASVSCPHGSSDLDLDSLQLTGSIPDCIGALKQLLVLDLSSNQLGGTITSTLAPVVINAGATAIFRFNDNLSSLVPSPELAAACNTENTCHF